MTINFQLIKKLKLSKIVLGNFKIKIMKFFLLSKNSIKKDLFFFIPFGLILILNIFLFVKFFLYQKKEAPLKLENTPITSQYLYQSKSKGFAVYLGSRQEENSPKVKFASSRASIDFKPLNIKTDSIVIKNEKSVLYQGVLPGVDISYSLTAKGIKEEIIIKTETAREKIITDGQILFEATVEKALLQEEKSKNGNFNFTDLQGKKPLFYIPQPFMIDSQNNRSEKVTLEFLAEPTSNQNNQNKFTVKLAPNLDWLKKATLPIIIDPTVEISIINVQSYPQTGENWEVSFNTQGADNLTITPDSPNSINDLDFISLSCGSQILSPQILDNNVIFYPDWSCNQEGKIIHKVNQARNHILKFQFGEQIAFAHNAGLPGDPTSLLTEGLTNPIGVTDTTPEFSAIYNDIDIGDTANKYQIQVDDDPAFVSTIWDSGGSGTTLTPNCVAGARCVDISYAGSALASATKYYWRIKYWDVSSLAPVTGEAKAMNNISSYLDFTNYSSNVKISNLDGHFSGYAFLEDMGWVAFGTTDNALGPVEVNLSTGVITGKAKVLNTGAYLDFNSSPYNSNVTLNLNTGVFSGYVWSEDVGWLDFTDTGVFTNVFENWSTEEAYFTTSGAPAPPTSLLTEGQTNPSNVTDITPEFSAIYNDDTGDIANYYQIQVDDDPAFGSILWNSNKTSLSPTCMAGNRCADISYGGAATDLQWGKIYYWRIKYWDTSFGLEGTWSTESAYFTMFPIYEPTACMIDDSGQPSQSIVKWADNTTLETGYRVERSVDGGAWTLLSTENANTILKTDTGVSSNHTYKYRIQATSGNGNSEWTATSQVDYAKGNLQMQGILVR